MATILLVDDHDAVRTATALMLERAGHDVETLSDGSTVLQQCQAHHFDAVVTDIVMPKKDGLKTIRSLREAQPDLPIIAISGGGGQAQGPKYLDAAHELGVFATLEKPIDSNRLCAVISEVIAARSSS